MRVVQSDADVGAPVLEWKDLLDAGQRMEILYFDDAGSAERPPESLEDHRELPARPKPGQLRFDALSREWVAVAAHRQLRTHLPGRRPESS